MSIKENISKLKMELITIGTSLILFNNNVFAETVEISSNGGKIRESSLGTGIFNIAQDISGTLRWLIPVVSIPFILWFIFKIYSSEEQEQPRYKKRLITTIISVMCSTLVTVIINLVLSYFTTN